MTVSVPEKKSDSAANPSRFLGWFLSRLAKLAYYHSIPVILVSLGLAVFSVWVTMNHLKFNTSRSDLLSKNLDYFKQYKEYRAEFEDFDGMIVVVEGDHPESMKNFAESLVKKLEENKANFPKIFYKVDTEYFKDKAFLYLDIPELIDLREKLEAHQDFLEKVNGSPGLNTLLRSINAEISVGMVDSLLSDFIGAGDVEEDEEEKDESADLSLLIELLKQMVAHLNGDSRFVSPWASFLSNQGASLKEEGYLTSGDGSLLFILVNPASTKGDFAGSRDSIRVMRKLIQDLTPQFPEVKVGLTGEDVIASDEMVTTQVDVKKASKMALLGVTLLFIVAYRGVREPLLAVFALIIGLCWSMGYTTLTIGHLNILSVVFTTILIGLGIDFGIHVLERYREERNAGNEVYPALCNTLNRTGKGNTAGAITTAIAFGSMTLTDFVGIAELGWIAGGGILFCLLAMILLLPALITVMEKKWGPPHGIVKKDAGERKIYEAIFDHYSWIIAVCFILVVAAAFSFRTLSFDYNLLNLQAKGTEAVQNVMKIIEKSKRATWHAAMITDSFEEARKKYKEVKAIPEVGKVESILSAVPEDQEEKIKIVETITPWIEDLETEPEDEIFSLKGLEKTMKKIRFKLRKKEEDDNDDYVYQASQLVKQFQADLKKAAPKQAEKSLENFSSLLFKDYRNKLNDLQKAANPTLVKIEELPSNLRERFISAKGKYLLLIFPDINIWERPAMESFLGQLREIDPRVTGNAVHMYESSKLMINGYVNGGIYAMTAIVIFLLASFRNIRTVILILLPTLVGSVWTVGIMDVFGIRFNMANLVILPLIIGIGVVNGVHIVNRYREDEDKGTTILSKSTGQAVVLSSLTTMIGFGSLMVADHQGVYSLGLVLTIGVGSCLLTSITLLPALLKLAWVNGWKV
ncbi:MAG: MMPL family transporter [Nitrospinae bacterium]|nr:MMPL family transporter [Nitrospinota bacterium]